MNRKYGAGTLGGLFLAVSLAFGSFAFEGPPEGPSMEEEWDFAGEEGEDAENAGLWEEEAFSPQATVVEDVPSLDVISPPAEEETASETELPSPWAEEFWAGEDAPLQPEPSGELFSSSEADALAAAGEDVLFAPGAEEEDGDYVFSGNTLILRGMIDSEIIDWEAVQAERVEYIYAVEGSCLMGDCSGLFAGLSNLRSADLTLLDATYAEDLSRLFSGCSSLSECLLPETPAVYCQSISGMFEGCASLTSLDLSNWQASFMEDTSFAFDGCKSLTKLLLPDFVGAQIYSMRAMFRGLSLLSELDVSLLDTSWTEDFSEVFKGCAALESLDLSGFGWEEVTALASAFEGCTSLSDLVLPAERGDGEKAAYVSRMFALCKGLKELALPGFPGGIEDTEMFAGAPALERLTLLGDFWVRESACLEKGENGWADVTAPRTIVSGSGTYAVLSEGRGGRRTFARQETIEKTYRFEDVDAWNGVLILGSGEYNRYTIDFSICKDKSFDVVVEDGADVRMVGDCSHMFEEQLVRNIELEKMDFTWVTDLSYCFAQCTLKEAVFNDTDILQNLESTRGMFENCPALWEVVLPRVAGNCLKDISRMFYGAHAAKLDAGNFSVGGVTDMSEAFCGFQMWNPSLASAQTVCDLSSWEMGDSVDCSRIFADSAADVLILPNDHGNILAAVGSMSDASIKVLGAPEDFGIIDLLHLGLNYQEWRMVQQGYGADGQRSLWVRNDSTAYYVNYVDARGMITTGFITRIIGENYNAFQYLPTEGFSRFKGHLQPWYAAEVKEGEKAGFIFEDGGSLDMYRGLQLQRNAVLSLYTTRKDLMSSIYLYKVTGADDSSVLEVNGGRYWSPAEYNGLLENATLRVHGGSVELGTLNGHLQLDWKVPGTTVKIEKLGVDASFDLRTNFVSLSEPRVLVTEQNIRRLLPGGITTAAVVHFDTLGKGTAQDQLIVADGHNTVEEIRLTDVPGYTFKGWLLESEPYDFSAPVERSELTLTANWEKIEETTDSFQSFALSLDGDLSLYFYLSLPGGAEENQSVYVNFRVNGNTQRVTFADSEHLSGDLYGFPCRLTAAQMADEITAIFHCRTRTEKIQYSLLEYLNYFGKNSGNFDEKTIALAEAIADYGHYCQPFLAKFNGWTIGTDHLFMPAVHDLAPSEIERVRAEAAPYEDRREGKMAGKICYTLSLRSKPTMTVYYPVEDSSPDAAAIRVLVDGVLREAEKRIKDGKLTYFVQIEDIPAKDSHVEHEVVFLEGEEEARIFLSPLSYVQMELDPAYSHGEEGMMAVVSFYRFYEAVKTFVQ